jgi:uncharacterized phage protein (TIGR01671 family)
MREILFRGKRTDNGEWIEGYFFKKINAFTEDGLPIKHYISDLPPFGAEIIPETVGQYTGLTDKNGKKIFEGDIVICGQEINGNWIDRHVEIGYVEMKHGAFGLHRKQGYYRPFKDWLEDYEYEVIGNIHDNPELLKGGEGDD